MSTLEQDLSQAMAAFAEGAPDDLGLLSRVQAGSRRRTRNRRVAAAVGIGALAAAVAVVVVGPVGIPQAQNRYADPTRFLVDSRDLALRFPLTPSYLPPGLDPTPLLEETGHFGTAEYLRGDGAQHQVYVSHAERPYPADGSPTAVSGKPATQKCDDNQCSLTWQRAPELFVMVVVTPATSDTAAIAHRVAEGLTDAPVVHRPRLVLGLTPAKGCVLNDPVGLSTSMNPVDLPDASATCPVSASVYTKEEATQAGYPDAVGQRVHVGGYAGWLQERDPVQQVRHGSVTTTVTSHQWLAVLELRDGRRLVVVTARTGGWNRTELDRFVKAILVPAR